MGKLFKSMLIALIVFFSFVTPIHAESDEAYSKNEYGIEAYDNSGSALVTTGASREHVNQYYYILAVLGITGSIVGVYLKKYDEDM